jgi:hypothetical protein
MIMREGQLRRDSDVPIQVGQRIDREKIQR